GRCDYADRGADELAKLASDTGDPEHAFGTDEDANGPYAVDPLTQRWDLGADPVAFAAERLALVDRVLPRLADRVLADGDPYHRLRETTLLALGARFDAAYIAAATVGGVYFSRQHRGGPAPLAPVPADRQRQALKLAIDAALSDRAVDLRPDLLNQLGPRRMANLDPGAHVPLDFPIHRVALEAQARLLDLLLDPVRLTRIIDNAARVPAKQALALPEVFDALTAAIFRAWAGAGAPSLRRRNLPRAHLDRL